MGSKLHICLTQQSWLWLLSLSLINVFVYLPMLEEPQSYHPTLSLESHSLMIFTIIKEKLILGLDIFSDHLG